MDNPMLCSLAYQNWRYGANLLKEQCLFDGAAPHILSRQYEKTQLVFMVFRYLFGFKSPEGDLKPNIALGGSAPHTPAPMFVFKSPEGDLKTSIFCGGAPPPHPPPMSASGLRPPASGVSDI